MVFVSQGYLADNECQLPGSSLIFKHVVTHHFTPTSPFPKQAAVLCDF